MLITCNQYAASLIGSRVSSLSIVTVLHAGPSEDRIPVRWEIFRTHHYRSWYAPSFLCNGHRVSFLGVKWLGRGPNCPPPCSAEVKEKVEIYLYSPSGSSWLVLGRALTFLNHIHCVQRVICTVGWLASHVAYGFVGTSLELSNIRIKICDHEGRSRWM
jgi:hypothetical protein